MKHLIILILFIFLGCKKDLKIDVSGTTPNVQTPPVTTTPPPVVNTEPKIKEKILLSDRSIVWGLEVIDETNFYFTERSGKMGHFSKGTVSYLSGLPTDILTDGQGGLLDICLDPNFKTNQTIYFSYAANKGGLGQLNVVKSVIADNKLTDNKILLSSSATNSWKGHYGSRLAFDKQGFLYVSIGEGGKSSYGGKDSPNQNSQNLKEAWGKIHRIKSDGGIPADNPIFEPGTTPTSIYSYGHRNPQGLFIDQSTNEIFNNEHGPRGGDELNQVLKGKNYGWPLVSHGVNYDGKSISGSPLMTGVQDVVFQWTPSIGASGLTRISSDKYGTWKGDFLSGALALTHLSKTHINDMGKAESIKLLSNIGRVRDVVQGQDGFLYIAVENPGRVIKLEPSF